MFVRPEHPDELSRFLKKNPLILYGMGDTGQLIAKWCDEQEIHYLCSDKRIEELRDTNREWIAPQRIVEDYPTANVAISSIAYKNEITDDLLRLGVKKEKILLPSIFMPEQVKWEDVESHGRARWNCMHHQIQMIKEWGWMPEQVKSLADYGAGHKFIKEILPATTVYYPIDFIDRGDNTIVCDFNKREFPNISTELSVCLGVLMYIEPAEDLINHICKHTKQRVIFSYQTLDNMQDLEMRRLFAICQDFTEQQIVDMFLQRRYQLRNRKYDDFNKMTYFLFENEKEIP